MAAQPFHDRDGWIWFNGEFIPHRDANVHVLTHALHYASTVFEGERAYGGIIFRSRDHSQRLHHSARILGFEIPYSVEDIEQAKRELIVKQGFENCYVRALAWRGSDMMGVGAKGARINVAIAAWPWGAYLGPDALERGIRVKTSSFARHHVNVTMCRAKSVGTYMNSILANQEAVQDGYDEALLLYVLALGSPTYPLPDDSYPAWLSTYVWKKIYDYEFVYAGPLFIHQLSHIWIDFRGIQDVYMRDKGLDYFENSRRATYVQREYAIRNPREFAFYSKDCWGLTASDGPGPATLKVDGVEREFFDYLARGAPHGPDDGTIAPWAVVASLPFAPEIVFPAVRYFTDQIKLEQPDSYGFKATFNPTFPVASDNAYGWVSPWNFGLNQGPIVLMIENQRTGLIWRLVRQCPYIVQGLRRAGFRGGWL